MVIESLSTDSAGSSLASCVWFDLMGTLSRSQLYLTSLEPA